MDCLLVMCMSDCFSCFETLMALALSLAYQSYLVVDSKNFLEARPEDSDAIRTSNVIGNDNQSLHQQQES
jgi:hypothetical protein